MHEILANILFGFGDYNVLKSHTMCTIISRQNVCWTSIQSLFFHTLCCTSHVIFANVIYYYFQIKCLCHVPLLLWNTTPHQQFFQGALNMPWTGFEPKTSGAYCLPASDLKPLSHLASPIHHQLVPFIMLLTPETIKFQAY